jgi:hypothetical protein
MPALQLRDPPEIQARSLDPFGVGSLAHSQGGAVVEGEIRRPTPQGPPERSWRQMIWPVLWALRAGPHGQRATRTIAGGARRGGLRLGQRPLVQRAKANLNSTPGSSRKRQRKRQAKRGSGNSRAVISGSAKGRGGSDLRSEFPDAEPTSKPRPRREIGAES